MTSLQKTVKSIADEGRAGDELVGHLTPGDMIIPKEIHTPELTAALRKHFASHGASADQYIAGHKENSINPKTGIPEFGFFKNLEHLFSPVASLVTDGFTGLRDSVEAGASLAGNYFLPGSSILTDKLVSKGAQKDLNSTVGRIAQIGSGLAGGGIGESVTGIPSAAEVGGGWTNAANAVGGLAGDATLGTDISNGISGLFNGATGTIGESTGAAGDFSANGVQSLPGGISSPSTSVAGASAGSLASPTSILDDPSSLLSSGTTPASVGSELSGAATANVGTGTAGTQGLSDTFSGFGTQPGGANIPGAAEGAKSAFTPDGTGTSLKDFISSPSLKGAGNLITSNPGTVLGAAGLGLDALKQQTPMKGTNQINQIADQERQQGAQLQSYLNSGTLPAGLQQSLNQATESAKATIRSQYASRGMSGSSAEQQDLQAVDQRAQAQGAEQAMQLMQTGIGETGMSAQLYQSLLNGNLEQDKDLGSAIAGFASASAGGTPRTA